MATSSFSQRRWTSFFFSSSSSFSRSLSSLQQNMYNGITKQIIWHSPGKGDLHILMPFFFFFFFLSSICTHRNIPQMQRKGACRLCTPWTLLTIINAIGGEGTCMEKSIITSFFPTVFQKEHGRINKKERMFFFFFFFRQPKRLQVTCSNCLCHHHHHQITLEKKKISIVRKTISLSSSRVFVSRIDLSSSSSSSPSPNISQGWTFAEEIIDGRIISFHR